MFWIPKTEQSDYIQFEVAASKLILFLEAKDAGSSSWDVEGEPYELQLPPSWWHSSSCLFPHP